MNPQRTAAAMLGLGLAASVVLAGPRVHELSFDSDSYHIDRIYRSMKGPMSRQVVQLVDERLKPELLWIVGYRTEIVGGSGDPLSPEFMCHNNLGFADVERHAQLFNWPPANPRLFTLSQGQMEVRFPEGLGIPLQSHERLHVGTQVLNLNPQAQALDVRHRTTLYFVRDAELETPMKALYQTAAQGLVALNADGLHFNLDESSAAETHGPGCAVGQRAGERVIRDRLGREFAAHWTVPPGRQVHRTLVSGFLQLPEDTTVHYIAVHLHPFAESLELRDLTSGESVFKSAAVGPEGKIGLRHVEHYSSREGVLLRKDHSYELVSTYDNTTNEEQDAMAVMFLYLHDRQFRKPVLE